MAKHSLAPPVLKQVIRRYHGLVRMCVVVDLEQSMMVEVSCEQVVDLVSLFLDY